MASARKEAQRCERSTHATLPRLPGERWRRARVPLHAGWLFTVCSAALLFVCRGAVARRSCERDLMEDDSAALLAVNGAFAPPSVRSCRAAKWRNTGAAQFSTPPAPHTAERAPASAAGHAGGRRPLAPVGDAARSGAHRCWAMPHAQAMSVESLARDSGASSVNGNNVRYNREDVRLFDLKRPIKHATQRKLLDALLLLDIWDLRSFKGQSRREAAWNIASRLLPCLTWLKRYQWRTRLAKDVAAGIAVTFLIVPQGLSYAGIAGLPAIYGLYTDFVPVFVFALYTSAMHLQVGAVAVVSLLTQTTVSRIVAPHADAVSALKDAAAATAKAASAQRSNATLAALSVQASAAYNAGNVALIREQVDTANLLAFFVGLFSVAVGLLKLGSIMNLMGPAVCSGFQSAAAVTIALGQLKSTFGYGKDFTQSTRLHDLIASFVRWQGELNARAAWTGWLWFGLMVCMKYAGRLDGIRLRGVRVLRPLKFSGPVLLCITAILATKFGHLYLSPGCSGYDGVKNAANVFVPSALLRPASWNLTQPVTATDSAGHLVTYLQPRDAPGCVPMPKAAAPASFLPDPVTPWGSRDNPWPRWRGISITGAFGTPPRGRMPRFSLLSGDLLIGAAVITAVASLESIAIAKALATKHRTPGFDPSREYIALGLANVAGAFTGAYPVGGSFSRSALNDDVGGSSPVVALVVATLVGFVLKLASAVPMFYHLPQNALSAIVIASLLSLLDFSHFIFLCRYDRKDALLWLSSFAGVLFAGVEIGILIAIILSLALVVVETIFAPAPLLGLVPGNSRRSYRSVRQYPEAVTVPGVAIMRVEAPLIFFNCPSVFARVRALVYRAGQEDSGAARTRAVVLDLSNVPYVDSAFLDEFGELIRFFKRESVLLALANPNSNVLHKLTVTPLLGELNTQFGETRDWAFLTVSDAVDAVLRFEPPLRPVKLQMDE